MSWPQKLFRFALLIIVVVCVHLNFEISKTRIGLSPWSWQVHRDIKQDVTSKFKLNPITHVYEIDDKPVIWHYWDTDNVPLYARLLIEAMQCRNPEFNSILVHKSTIYEYLPDLNVPKDVFSLLHGPHQADIFRIAALVKYGGVYLDVDTYPLDKIYPLYALLPDYDVVITYYESGTMQAQSAMGPTRANTSYYRIWHQNQLRRIKEFFLTRELPIVPHRYWNTLMCKL